MKTIITNKGEKMKTIIQNAFIIVTVFFTMTSTANSLIGTGAGNGGNGPRQSDNTTTVAQLQPEETQNNQQDNKAVDYEVYSDLGPLYYWGNNSIHELRSALHSARLQIIKGFYNKAGQVLIDALSNTSKSFPKKTVDHGSPLTKKLIDRGILYARNIKTAFQEGGFTKTEIHTETYFLEGYVQMIINAWEEIDQDYYIPYYHSYERRCSPHYYCEDFSYIDFHRKYIEYVIKEIEFVLNNFTEESHIVYRGPMILPIGDVRAVLLISEIMSIKVSKDILETLWPYKYGYIAFRLQELHKNLKDFNRKNNRLVYPDAVAALNSSRGIHSTFLFAVEELEKEGGHYSRKVHNPVLARNIFLSSNNPEYTIHLNYSIRINCLVVTGEAYRSDGRVKVLVNGQIKGDLYLPRRDPQYVVNVDSRANSIRFVMEQGTNVRIQSVKIREDCYR